MATFTDPIVKLDAQALKLEPMATEDATPVAIDRSSQLFVDDWLVADSRSLFRRLNTPRKTGATILAPERPYEGQAIVYGSIVETDGRWRLYYKGWNQSPLSYDEFSKRNGYGKYPICVAESDDCLTFVRPALPTSPAAGGNIVIDDQIDDFCVLRDPGAADGRFKLLASRGNWWAGLSAAASDDGVVWKWGAGACGAVLR